MHYISSKYNQTLMLWTQQDLETSSSLPHTHGNYDIQWCSSYCYIALSFDCIDKFWFTSRCKEQCTWDLSTFGGPVAKDWDLIPRLKSESIVSSPSPFKPSSSSPCKNQANQSHTTYHHHKKIYTNHKQSNP